MTYKIFKNLVERLLKIKKDEERLNTSFKLFEPDFNYISFGRFETLVVDAIKGDDDKNDWLGYFLYEMDCKFSKKRIGKDKKKPIFIRNMKDLYNLIYEEITKDRI